MKIDTKVRHVTMPGTNLPGNRMYTTITATYAHRRFADLLRIVKKGRGVIVTSHGKPVAIVTPAVEDERTPAAAHVALFARLRTESSVNAGCWTRDELYDEGP